MWYGDAAILKGPVEDVEAQSGGSGVCEEKKKKQGDGFVVHGCSHFCKSNNGCLHTRKFLDVCDLASISFLQLEFSMASILPCLRVWSKPVSSLIHLKMR
jgi:hypothetical protein